VPPLRISLHSQEGLDAAGRLQSHQWAEVPPEIAAVYLSGGLKKIRRLTERYLGFAGSPAAAARVRSRWRAGEPHLRLCFHHVPFVHGKLLLHLGRLRQTGTRHVYRGWHEIRGGSVVSDAARLDGSPWPADIPWAAPSAGEFIDSESRRRAYLGIFEIRVERAAAGCTLHTLLVDFPPAERGFRALLGTRPWAPLRRGANLAFLRSEVEATARAAGHDVQFEFVERPGTPARVRFDFSGELVSRS
jgi:hypothetical protein